MPSPRTVAIVISLGLVGSYLYWSAAAVPANTAVPVTAKPPARMAAAAWPPLARPASAPSAERHDSPLLPIDQSQPAVLSLTEAREHGDARTPPLQPSAPAAEPASAWEMADPQRYQAYEQRQQKRLYQAYVDAADKALPLLAADLARARAEGGVPAAEIAQVEEKQRRITAMQAELRSKLAQP